MFASKSLTEHVARGAVGIGVLVGTMMLIPDHPLLALAGIPVALIALRGCPACWTIGLFETIAATARGRACPCGEDARRDIVGYEALCTSRGASPRAARRGAAGHLEHE